MQVEAREEGEEERPVDMEGEVQRESRCRTQEHGCEPFGLVLALGALGLDFCQQSHIICPWK